jgi:flavorubredoxin
MSGHLAGVVGKIGMKDIFTDFFAFGSYGWSGETVKDIEGYNLRRERF